MLIIDGNGRILTSGSSRVDITPYLQSVEMRYGTYGHAKIYAELLGVEDSAYFGKLDHPMGPRRVIFRSPSRIYLPSATTIDLASMCEDISVSSRTSSFDENNILNCETSYIIKIVANVVQEPATPGFRPPAPAAPPSGSIPVNQPNPPEPQKTTPKAKPEVGEAIFPEDEEMFP